ncbi:MAG: 4Fe-4S dicluster domain-containing protein [Anaerolineae bacterium]
MNRIVIHEEYCIGCRLCEVHCLVAHSSSRDIIKAYRDERNTIMPRVIVEESGPLSFAMQCRQCQDPRCLEACPSGAIQRAPGSGTITLDESRCVGCWMCIMVCPVGAVQQSLTEHKVASKCDLCQDLGEPACVAHCPNEALTYEEVP